MHYSQQFPSISTHYLFYCSIISPQVLESRALYNLGNVYQARGKNAVSSGLASNHDKASLEDYVRTSLEQATRHYE